MNENITVIVAAAVVVLAGFGIVTMAEADVCDYTILDSPGNLAAGQTFHVTQVMAGITVDSEYRLTDASGGEVDFVRTTVSSSGYVDLPADNLLPGVVLVDYSDPDNVPAGITVDRSADLYVINGSHTEGDTTTVYDDLRINYNGTAVTAAEGKFTLRSSSLGSDNGYQFRTVAGDIQMKQSGTSSGSGTEAADEFIGMIAPVEVVGYPVEHTVTQGRMGNVAVEIHTYRGTFSDGEGEHTVDLTYHVYHGIVLKAEGTGDGNYNYFHLTVKA